LGVDLSTDAVKANVPRLRHLAFCRYQTECYATGYWTLEDANTYFVFFVVQGLLSATQTMGSLMIGNSK
jgi:hypothetical protein